MNIQSLTTEEQIQASYELAKERYAALSVDTERAMDTLAKVSITLNCAQEDDRAAGESTATRLGLPRTCDELRQDLDQAFKMLPGQHRLSLSAHYAEAGDKKVERNEVLPEHFSAWVDWSKTAGRGMDFAPACFAHPMADSGLTLSSPNAAVTQYWVEHCIASRAIGESFGKALGSPCLITLWLPDGVRDMAIDRATPREKMKESLDRIFAGKVDKRFALDALEGTASGKSSENFCVVSPEFALGYAVRNGILPTLNCAKPVTDKLSGVLAVTDELALRISRRRRFAAIQNDEVEEIGQELVRGNLLDRVRLSVDNFDPNLNHVAGWVISGRAVQKALLMALLEPHGLLFALERAGDYTARLAQIEALKSMPWGAIWNQFCLRQNVPVRVLDEIREYERRVLSERV